MQSAMKTVRPRATPTRRLFGLLSTVALVSGCGSSVDVEALLKSDGYTNLYVEKSSLLATTACGKGDSWAREFVGHRGGLEIRGVVCGSAFAKGATIRVLETNALAPTPVDRAEKTADSLIAAKARAERQRLIDSIRSTTTR